MSTNGELRGFDADNHYYEAMDAFTRHIEPEYAKRAMQWAEIDGKTRLLVGGRVNRFIPNPTFDQLAKPGSLEQYFRGNNESGAGVVELFGELEPTDPAYRDRDIRLKVMDDQRIDGALFFPTLGVGMEEALRDDLPAARPRSARSTAGSTTTGASTTRSGSSPRPISRCPTSTRPWPSSSGCSTAAPAS